MIASAFRRAAQTGLIALLVMAAGSPARSQAPERLKFNRDVRPILSEHCYACHGPDKNQRKADLRLDDRAAALDAKAFVPGKAADSELVKRILSDDADTRMPPAEANKPLSAAQKDTLKRWVSEGAEYEGHWAYVPPTRPIIPADKSAVDFLLERELQKHGLAFSPEADRRTLARRLSFDLTGLPPTAAEVDAFAKDTAPDAYEKLVDRLIASPHYGERMAQVWLDVVRFADTIGYHSDNPRNIWPYRDYVIRSFQQNKPFDQFTREQIAGDLLPNPTQETRVGSAFNRLLLTTEEGGAQAKDYEARMLTDRVRAIGTAWLGLTIGCCQCHDHKFDPTTTRDFYAMGAFFADIQEPIIGRREDGMLVPNEKQQADLTRIDAELARAQQDYDAPHPEFADAQLKWEQTAAEDVRRAALWTVLKPERAWAEGDRPLKVDAIGVITAEKNPAKGVDTYRHVIKTDVEGITGVRVEALADKSLPGGGPGRAGNGNFVLSEVDLTAALIAIDLEKAIVHATHAQEKFPASAVIDGENEKNNGWAISGGTGRDQSLTIELEKPIPFKGADTSLFFTLIQNHGDNHVLGRYRLLMTKQPKPLVLPSQPLPPAEVAAVLAVPPAQRNDAQKEALKRHFRGIAPEFAALRSKLDAAKKSKADLEASIPRCIVSVSMATPRTVRILPRGNWLDESGPVMQPGLPEFLAGKRTETGKLTRRDLAEFLLAKENPLTARVFVNRLWKQFFGIGLTKTMDDFGAQGEWPSNPELLDWLAVEFRDTWNVRRMVRTLVLSRAYRQSSTASKEALVKDPDNRLIARQSRFRLDAELVRDNALAISGLLVRTIGGPSVKPYQPDGYWENLNFPARTWVADANENQYRRGLYTWWQRSFPHPSLTAFDAPSREECAADRPRSNIPQQALVLLNDPSYVEASRAFAARIMKEGGADTDARLKWAWQQALQRDPRADELATVKLVLEKHQVHYMANPQEADAVLKIGIAPRPADVSAVQLAAWTSAARILLNLHETITRN
ncbi:MAG: PSD1 domain-containing protein [Planctomycetaceae bacterium]|nr:PSD1 domain-containing protein [Planctomycetaceae bacterium]